jgi:hypothetical protein
MFCIEKKCEMPGEAYALIDKDESKKNMCKYYSGDGVTDCDMTQSTNGKCGKQQDGTFLRCPPKQYCTGKTCSSTKPQQKLDVRACENYSGKGILLCNVPK